MADPSSKKRMSEIGDESRTRILDAAETLFLEKGYERTTLVDVGKLAGISYGSIDHSCAHSGHTSKAPIS